MHSDSNSPPSKRKKGLFTSPLKFKLQKPSDEVLELPHFRGQDTTNEAKVGDFKEMIKFFVKYIPEGLVLPTKTEGEQAE